VPGRAKDPRTPGHTCGLGASPAPAYAARYISPVFADLSLGVILSRFCGGGAARAQRTLRLIFRRRQFPTEKKGKGKVGRGRPSASQVPIHRQTAAKAATFRPPSPKSLGTPTDWLGLLEDPGICWPRRHCRPKTRKIAVPVALVRPERPPARACGSWPPSRLVQRNRQPCRLPPRPCGRG
jgi:hypothetical protein